MDQRANRLLLANAILGTFLGGVAVRIFYVAMPTVASSLGTDVVGISWAILSYQVANIGLSLIFGRIGDLYGRHNVFVAGYLVLMTASVLCGLSSTLFELIGFRILQGVGAALTHAVARALAAEAMPEEKAGKAQGYMTTAHHFGFLLGPSLGGLIIEYMSWRWAFFSLVPLCAVGLLLSFVKRSHTPTLQRQITVDYLGAALLLASTATLVVLLDRRSVEWLTAGPRIALGSLFLISLLGLLIRENRIQNPIVDFSLFKIGMFTISTLCHLMVAVIYSLSNFLLPFYLQDVLRFSPSVMGALFVTAPILTVLFGPVSGYVCDRVGPRPPATAGIVMLTASVLVGVIFKTDSQWTLPTLMLVLLGLANGFFNPANSVGIIHSVSKEQRGFASGSINVMFGLGSILGISLGNFLVTMAFRAHTGIPDAPPTPANPEAFVAALNYTFLAAVVISLTAMASSIMRGKRASAAR